MDQPSVRDPNVTIKQMVAAATAKTGENVTVTRFVRFKLGETTENLGAWGLEGLRAKVKHCPSPQALKPSSAL